MSFWNIASTIIFKLYMKSGGNLAEFQFLRKGILAESEVIMIFNSLKSAF